MAPNTDFHISNHGVRKNAHFFAYLVLGILVLDVMMRSDVIRYKSMTLLICISYAISDEIHQYFVPNRGPGIKDIFIDSAGVCVGIIIYLGLCRIISVVKNK